MPIVATIFGIAVTAAEPLMFDVAKAELAYDQRTGEPVVSFRNRGRGELKPRSGQAA